MARTEHVVTLFLSAPADLALERCRARDVVVEVNRGAGRDAGVRFEIAEADLVTEDAPEFDVFVGLLGHRHGSVLQSAGSGSVEELEAGRDRTGRPGGAKGLFYFSDVPVALSALDPDAVGRVLAFRASLGGRAAGFADTGHLTALLRLDLVREVAEWRTRLGPAGRGTEAPARRRGFVDLSPERTAIEERFKAAAEAAGQLGTAARALSGAAEARGRELAELGERTEGRPNPRLLRPIADGLRDDVANFRTSIEAALPTLRGSLRGGVEVASRLVAAHAAARGTPEREALSVLPVVIGAVLATVEAALGPVTAARDVLAALPAIGTAVSEEGERALAALDAVLDEVRRHAGVLQALAAGTAPPSVERPADPSRVAPAPPASLPTDASAASPLATVVSGLNAVRADEAYPAQAGQTFGPAV